MVLRYALNYLTGAGEWGGKSPGPTHPALSGVELYCLTELLVLVGERELDRSVQLQEKWGRVELYES